MGKKPHPPRNVGGSKKPTVNPIPDSDHIIFSNDKDKPKKSGNKPNAPVAKAGPSSAVSEPQPPKPNAREIIGGASWTGKLPQTLLAEHCQKQKWMKPDFSMRQVPGGGFQSAATLSTKNPKTGQVTTLPPFLLPPGKRELATQPSALEARHFAAAWTLFRISSMKNIHMMLPPQYRDLWKGEFQQIKQDDVKAGLDWMYAADPFIAHQERETAKAEAAKKREAIEREKQKAAKETKISFMPANGTSSSSSSQKNSSKGWQHAQILEMGDGLRSDIEDIVRRKAIWNPYQISLSGSQKKKIVEDLAAIGFRYSHVEEAMGQCKDREEALEWLLTYVPEDDLPQWALPEGYSAGITFASGNLVKEAALKRLGAAGYPMDDCERVYKQSKGDENLAAAMLQKELCKGLERNPTAQDNQSSDDDWNEEMTTLESIYADRFSLSSPTTCTVSLELPTKMPQKVQVRFIKPAGHYPDILPILFILSANLPAYIRLSATMRALEWAEQSLIGEPMMFGMIDWLENSLAGIIDDPGPLRDISMTTSPEDGGGEVEVSNSVEARQRVRGGIWKAQGGPSQNKAILEAWESKQRSSQQQKMLHARQGLPAWDVRESLIDTVKSHQVTIISGETGSGKSTQSVQFILDDMIQELNGSGANILCTQPRRISALGLADRVSAERCSSVGDEVGYIIRGDSKTSPDTRITFMTTGVLLRRLQSFDMSGSLSDVSHIVVDEVHERSLDTDFLLALLREAIKGNKELKVILMSATLDAQAFIDYFGTSNHVGLVNIAGRTFPVHDYYLDDVLHMTNYGANGVSYGNEDDDTLLDVSINDLSIGKKIQTLGMGINYDLISATVRHIDQQLGSKNGSILIFLPGTMEIDRCLNTLRAIPNIYGLPLHASLMPSEQKLVFLPGPGGKRKVIAATNVAETSITIEDAVAVIDSGRVKETRYDSENRVVRLEEVWSSQAAGKQRRGRAGRVREGHCYKLFTRKVEQDMAARPLPEIRRVPLEQLCLSVKATDEKRDVAAFLRQTLTPPEDAAIGVALQLLDQIGALEDGHLTALGRYLALIPADLRCAKLLVYGTIFGCLEISLTIASILTLRSPFVSPRDKREEAQEARASFSQSNGDLLLDMAAFVEWSERAYRGNRRDLQAWCSAMFLSTQTMRDIASTRSQLLTSLKDAGIVPFQYRSFSGREPDTQFAGLNKNNDNSALHRALIAASLTPQTARIQFPSKKFATSISGAKELDPEARTIKYFDHPQDSSSGLDSRLTGPQHAASSSLGSRLFIHPSSILFTAQNFPSNATFLSYFTKLSTSKLFVRDLTPFNLYTLLLFGSGVTVVPEQGGLLVDGGWIKVRGWARIGVLISRLRTLLDDVLRRRVEDTAVGWTADDRKVVDLVRRCVEFNGLDR